MCSKDNFDIYMGGKSGVFKGLKIERDKYVMENIQSLASITDNDEVTTISWGDDEEKEILIACGVKGTRSVKVYDTDCSTFTSSFFCNVGTGRISGISRYDEAILTAVHSGEVKLWRFEEQNVILIKAGDNLDRMRHSKINKNMIATGGNEHKLKLFDLERQAQVFIEKDVSHDSLQLRVPIWISDIDFLPSTGHIVTVSRHGHIRLYDPKTQRRPVINLEMKDEPLTTLAVTPREKQIIVGSGKGAMNLVDLREPAKILNTYKGFEGAVTGIACSTVEPYVVSVSLDRKLRIHHIDTKELLKKTYLTSRMSCMLLRSGFSLATGDETNKGCVRTHRNNTENLQTDERENSDSEYDTLFDAMPVITNKEDTKLMNRKRRKADDSSVNKEILKDTVTHNSPSMATKQPEKISKKLKPE